MSIKKYQNEQSNTQHDGALLYWPGTTDGFPIKSDGGVVPDLKKEETDNIDLQFDFKSQMFELWDSTQKREFDEINDRIVNGWYVMHKRVEHWDEDKKHLRVWLEWSQVYGMLPPKA